MADEATRCVETDANVLINFIIVGRLPLLGSLAPYRFLVPDPVVEEVTRSEQRDVLQEAMVAGHLHPVAISEPAELGAYAELRTTMGRGEAACLAVAQYRGWLIASDEKQRRFRRELRARLGEGRQITTPGLILLGIRRGLLAVEEADEIKQVLERHRFRMAFRSFRDKT